MGRIAQLENVYSSSERSLWKGACRIMRPMSLCVLVLLLLIQTIVLASGSYHFEAIAQTGLPLQPLGTIQSLGWGPSINDWGTVAFTGEDEDGVEGVFVGDGDSLEERAHLIDGFYYNTVSRINGLTTFYDLGDVVQLNNQNRVVWRALADDGLFGFVLRAGSTSDDFKIVAKKYYPRVDFPWLTAESPFSWLHPWVTMNNDGRIVFSGTLRSSPYSTRLCTPQDTESGGHSSYDDYYFSGSPGETVNLFPMLADSDYTCVRGGGYSTSPLLLFSDETLAGAWYLAEPPDYDMIAEKPSVSDDGVFVAFMGTHETLGGGIFGDIGRGPFKIAGVPGDGLIALYPAARVGVNRSSGSSTTDYTVAYLASRQETGALGLYVTDVDITKPASPAFSEPNLVIEVGDALPNLGTIQSIDIYDPVNNSGQLVFWVNTTTGKQAIVRTLGPTLESFDANHRYSPLDFPLDLPTESYMANLADFEPVNFDDDEDRQVQAVAADGVSLLLLRMTIPESLEGKVTFTLDDSSEDASGPLGTLWQVDDVTLKSLAEEKGNCDLEAPAGETTLSVEPILHDGKTFAFALYRAPRNFDSDGSASVGALSPDRVRSITIQADFSPLASSERDRVVKQKTIHVVRTPVLLVHGTWDGPSGWDSCPLWKGSANKENGFLPQDPDYPFTVFRLDYELNNAGRLETNARLILPQIEYAIGQFRTCGAFRDTGIYRVAATQADIVTHSYGGPIVRKAAQLQSYPVDSYPANISFTDGRSFRTTYNWGYGYIHKLVTLSGTHKGSQMAPHTARVNALSGGKIKKIAIQRSTTGYPIAWPIFISENRIDCGALADQNVVSPALKSLMEATYPSHAVVGSGLFEHSVPGNTSTFLLPLESAPFATFWWLMLGNPLDSSPEALEKRNGPYCLGSGSVNPYEDLTTARRLVNYVFNLDHEKGAQPNIVDLSPWPEGDGPNYDLTVRLSSMRGGLEDDAVTDVRHLNASDALTDGFVGQLTHLTVIGDREVAQKLGLRIAFLLRQPTVSKYFGRFPAVTTLIDKFDKEMMEKFPDVENELQVCPPEFNVPPCFEDEARERLNQGENGLDIIGYAQ